MIHSRNRTGFTLIEVLLAIAIVGMAMTPIIFLQTAVLTRVNKGMLQLKRIMLAKKFLFDAREKNQNDSPEFSLEKQEVDPSTLLVYRAEETNYPEVGELDGLRTERVIARWKEDGRPRHIILVTFTFRPVQEREK